jgi:hypothetical protein
LTNSLKAETKGLKTSLSVWNSLPMTNTSVLETALSTQLSEQTQRIIQTFQSGERVSTADVIQVLKVLRAQYPETLVPILGLLSIDGHPYSLDNHFYMEPVFKIRLPRRLLFKCARQVGKSATLSANCVIRSAGHPHLKTLMVTPRFEQVRRLSNNYVRPFIRNSLISKFLVDTSATNAVLQRSFANGAMLFFSFAFLDCDRIRGIACDVIDHDEIQDMDYDFIPIIRECMSYSQIRLSLYSGTPKTLDNTIEVLWQESSKAEWVMKCSHCGYWNMACIQADLMKMIELKGLSCAKCKNLIDAANGHWYHTDAENHSDFWGFHVPQPIVPSHYRDEEKWLELLAKRDGRLGFNEAKFLNEVLGESADSCVNLTTVTDIKRASKLGPNQLEKMIDRFRRCPVRAMGVDWGGGGAEEGTSFTSVALVGLNPENGAVECHFCERFPLAAAHDWEARRLLNLYLETGCMFFAHDYGGAGSVRETLMIQAGMPLDRIVPFMYVYSPAHDIVTYKPPALGELRGYYQLDKPRSLVLEAVCIKACKILLPEYESSKNITSDLLNLIENRRELAIGRDIMTIVRRPKMPDDFAHALNYGSFAIWHYTGQYPDLSAVQGIKMTSEQLNIANPPNAWTQSEIS